MRITVPVTGELIDNTKGFEVGSATNQVRPIRLEKLLPVEFLDFSWKDPLYDFDKGLVSIEISFKNKQIPIEWDAQGKVTKTRRETDEELVARRQASEAALLTELGKTPDELHNKTEEPKLKKPAKVKSS